MEEEAATPPTTTKMVGGVHVHPRFCKSRKPKNSKKKTQVDELLVSGHEVDDDGDGDGDGDEKVGIERRIMTLQKLVPGGETLEIDKLFEETAGYILALQGQVRTMKVLTNIFEDLDKENRKFGG